MVRAGDQLHEGDMLGDPDPTFRTTEFLSRQSLASDNGGFLGFRSNVSRYRAEDIAMAAQSHGPDKYTVDITAQPLNDIDIAQNETSQGKDTKRTSNSTSYSPLFLYTQFTQSHTGGPALQKVKQFSVFLKRYILNISEYIPDPLGRSIRVDLTNDAHQIERLSSQPYLGNNIASSRYTLYDFLPRQLAFQFSKVANIYFLSISILQMIPGLSTTGTYTTIIPLAIFISLAMAREGYDDYRRYRMDVAENNKEVQVLKISSSQVIKSRTKWSSLKVGDIVFLEKNDWIPADLVLLGSTGANGIAYLETAALDGETNLKIKQSIEPIANQCTLEEISKFRATIHSESPNADLYKYEGKVVTDDGQHEWALSSEQVIYRGSILRNTTTITALVIFTGEETKIRLNSSKNVRIKRPSMQSRVNRIVLAIVAFVVFLSIFCTCGYYIWRPTEDSLWYLDSANSISFLPIFIGFLILYNTMVPLSLYVSMEIVKLIQQLLLDQDLDMYHEESDTPCEARTSTINEELGQISHIFSDKTGTLTNNEMLFRRLSVAGHAWVHDLEQENLPAGVSSQLNKEEIRGNGKKSFQQKVQVFEVETSKRNVARLSCDRVPFRTSINVQGQSSRRQSASTSSPLAAMHGMQNLSSTIDMLRYAQSHPHTIFARRARLFLLSIALCHTAIPEFTDGIHLPQFSAPSPDELALVTAAAELGFLITDRNSQTVTLRTYPQGHDAEAVSEVYVVHDVIEFSSSRKRMSVVVEFPDGRLCVICKGADSVLLDRMRLKDIARNRWSQVKAKVNLRQSQEADRVIARKSLARPSISRPSIGSRSRLDSVRVLDSFLSHRRRDGALQSEGDPLQSSVQVPNRHSYAFGETGLPRSRVTADSLVDEGLAGDESSIFERTFEHLHAFAAEGLRVLMYGHKFISAEEHRAWKKLYLEASKSLQDRQSKIEHAAESIEVRFDLTGVTAIEDKLQDGVFQSIEKFRRAGIQIWMLTGDKRETAINIGHSAGLIKDYSTEIILDGDDPDFAVTLATKVLEISQALKAHTALIIDGATLAGIQDDPSLMALFLELAVAADTVICCRASPAQKALLVRLVRKEVKGSITLAIGDGANDIAMIREAHVGIGITGKEGLQAARSSDYSIAQFRFLVKLLLVHGRWNYIRISKYILATFYKEMFLFLTQAVFQRFVGYTGTSLHENWSLSLFNTLFSSLAVIIIGAFEQDLRSSTLLAVPELYETSRLGKSFGMKLLLAWMILAAVQAVSVFYLSYYTYAKWSEPDMFPFGNMIFTSVVVVINVKLIFFEMHSWSILNYSLFSISFLGWWGWTALQTVIYKPTEIYYVKGALFTGFGSDLSWWAALFLVTSALLLFDLSLQALRATFLATEEDCFREMQTDSALKARLEEEAALELQAGQIEDLLIDRGRSEVLEENMHVPRKVPP